jgi:hypothetical protein
MIKVKIVLHSARTGEKSLLGDVVIWNDGTGTTKRGNYGFLVRGRKATKILAKGEVRDFPRKSRTAVELLKRCLNAIKVR